MDGVDLPQRLLPKLEQGMFPSLVRSILYQQLAGAAADAIMKRFIAACKVSVYCWHARSSCCDADLQPPSST